MKRPAATASRRDRRADRALQGVLLWVGATTGALLADLSGTPWPTVCIAFGFVAALRLAVWWGDAP